MSWFAQHVEAPDPRWAHLFPYLERRFGLEVLLASGEPVHRLLAAADASDDDRLYRRLVDPASAASRTQIAALPSAVDRITASALHCDSIGLPGDWVEVLRKASRAGGYALTHAVLAAEWTLENGCLDEAALAGLHVEQVELLLALLDDRDALARQYPAAADLWLEALVMLHYAGAGGRVRPAWDMVLLGLQRPDGGWPPHPGTAASDAHATALALWALSERIEPRAPRIPWIPTRRPTSQ